MTVDPSGITTLSVWSEEQARVGDVLEAIEDLRKPEPMPATRTSVLTVVVLATRPASAERTRDALQELGGRHPARVITLLIDQDEERAGIDARVELLGGAVEGQEVWFEDVMLIVRGPVTAHLDSLVEPFTIPDLPVVAWFVDGLPALDDPMLAAADVVLVDARDLGDTACFSTLAALRPIPVVDLSWQRLRPWRELMAQLFDARAAHPFLAGVRSVTVTGKTGPRHLLAGWLADRLHVPSGAVHLEDAEHVSMEIAARDPAGRRGVFDVCRTSDERVVRARAAVDGGPAWDIVVPLPDATPAWGLADAFSRLHRDPVYEGALDAAIALANR